jgi:hypothetical protein
MMRVYYLAVGFFKTKMPLGSAIGYCPRMSFEALPNRNFKKQD